MNTSKQVNIMIGVVLLSILLFGGYMLNESSRQATAKEEVTEKVAERGARLFVNNCRTCHGLEGKGGVGPALDTKAFLVLGDDNPFGVPETPQGDADAVKSFLHNTISCGRTGTFMPTWGQQFGGPLSETQVNQIVTLITEGRWDLVEEIGAELDAETGRTAKDILPSDPSALAVTQKNCGQFNSETAADIRNRDPLAAPTATPATGGAATPTPASTPAPATGGGGGGIEVVLSEFKVTPGQASGPAGSVTFNVRNDGQIAHELTVIKTDLAAADLPQAAGKVDVSKVEVKGTTPDIASKRTGNLAVTLDAGKYVLVCQVPGHYGTGMRAAFTVQ